MGTNFVYRLVFPNGHFYIGSTKDIEKRIERHRRELKSGQHHNTNVQALHDAGHSFDLELDNFGTRKKAYAYEEKQIRENWDNPNMLNIGLAARGGDNLTKNPNRDAIITQITESLKAVIFEFTDAERSAKYGRLGEANGMFGKKHTDEVKAICSAVNKGNQYALGVVRSDEFKKGVSERAKLRTGGKNAFFGKQHSEDTKRKLREANIGKVPTNARRVEIDGVTYVSATNAAKELGCAVMTILNRINNLHEKFSGYRFLD